MTDKTDKEDAVYFMTEMTQEEFDEIRNSYGVNHLPEYQFNRLEKEVVKELMEVFKPVTPEELKQRYAHMQKLKKRIKMDSESAKNE
jgi:hypothetical protein